MTFIGHAIGHLALFGLTYYWLGLPASSTGKLALSAVLALIILLLVAYLVAFAFNRDARLSLSRIPPMLVWLGLLLPVAAVFSWACGKTHDVDQWINSGLTLATRTPVNLTYLGKVLATLLAILAIRLLLPVAARTANSGFEGLRDWRPVKLSLGYLAASTAYAFAGLWLPWTLFWWIPNLASFEGQMLSFILRLGAAFILYVAAWLIFAGHIRGQTLSPEREHPVQPMFRH